MDETRPAVPAPEPDPQAAVARLRAERDELQAKLDQVAEVIGCKDATKVVHDVRNVMNELGLLRKLAELED